MLSKDPRQTKGLMDSFDTYAGHRSAVHLLHWLQVLLHHGLSGLDLQQRAHVPKIDIYIYIPYIMKVLTPLQKYSQIYEFNSKL